MDLVGDQPLEGVFQEAEDLLGAQRVEVLVKVGAVGDAGGRGAGRSGPGRGSGGLGLGDDVSGGGLGDLGLRGGRGGHGDLSSG